jgi:hypothetical protein
MSRPIRKKGPDKVFIFGGALVLLIISIYLLIKFLSAPECAAGFHFHEKENGNIEPGRVVVFTDTTPGEVESREWDFGDGSSSNEVVPEHIYNVEGTYIVVLTINKTCSVSDTVVVMPATEEFLQETVYPSAIIDGPTEAFVGDPVQFYDRTPNSIERQWNFADTDDIIYEKDPVHTFTVAMEYTVTLDIKEHEQARHRIVVKRKKADAPRMEEPKKGGGGPPPPPPPPPAPVLKEADFKAAIKAQCGGGSLAIKKIGSFFGGTFNIPLSEPTGKIGKLTGLINLMTSNGDCNYLDGYKVAFDKDADGIITRVVLKK